MGWMEDWYRTMAAHNTGKCTPSECRHCKRETETKVRTAEAVAKAKILYGELKDTIIATVHADFNGGSDESFVDYVYYKDKVGFIIHQDDLNKIEPYEPWQSWSKQMEQVAWGILGHNFGVGDDYSVSGSIVLNVAEGKLYRCKEVLATLKEAA